jgi:hypothetical protein
MASLSRLSVPPPALRARPRSHRESPCSVSGSAPRLVWLPTIASPAGLDLAARHRRERKSGH